MNVSDKHREAVQMLLRPDEPLVALTALTRGVDIGTVGGVTNSAVHDIAGYLRERDLTELGIPGHPFAGGWVGATDSRLVFVVHKGIALRPKPKVIPFAVALDDVSLEWRDESSATVATRLYHFGLPLGANRMDLVRRGFADAQGDAFVSALGDRARPMAGLISRSRSGRPHPGRRRCTW